MVVMLMVIGSLRADGARHHNTADRTRITRPMQVCENVHGEVRGPAMRTLG